MANVGTATLGKVLIGTGSGSSPTFASIGTGSGLTTHGVVIAEGLSGFVGTNAGTNGQVLIASTGNDPAFATLTSSDSSITFTTGPNSLSLQVAGGSTTAKTITGDDSVVLSPSGGNWNILGGPGVTTSGSGSTLTINSVVFTDTTATTLASDNGYFATAAGTYTLPAAPLQGETVIVFCDTAGAVAVTANTGQTIRIGNSVSSTAGSLTSTARGDSLTLRYRASGTVWCTVASIGNWTVA